MSASDWSESRREAAAEHAARLARREAAEARAAQHLLDEFTPVMLRAGAAPQPLRVHGFGGRGSAASSVTGWPLRRDGTIALGADARMYRMTADLSILDRFRTVHLDPIDPPLVIGAGGRDGDSISLEEALERLLPGWRSR